LLAAIPFAVWLSPAVVAVVVAVWFGRRLAGAAAVLRWYWLGLPGFAALTGLAVGLAASAWVELSWPMALYLGAANAGVATLVGFPAGLVGYSRRASLVQAGVRR
jgi:hypothetical protein